MGVRDEKFLLEGKKKRSKVTNSNGYMVQATNISEKKNSLVGDKMRGEWLLVNCPFEKGSGHLASIDGRHVVSPGMPDLEIV